MFLLCLVFSLMLGIVYSGQARAADFVVTSSADDGGGDALTLREAVTQANANSEADTITFDLEAGDRTITLTQGQLTTASSTQTTIDGAGQITIDGNDQSRIFQVNNSANLTLRLITLTNGNAAGNGGAISNSGTLTVTDSTIFENRAGSGGGINNSGGTLTLTDSTISNNSASVGGGGIFSNTDSYSPSTTPPEERTTITNSTISGNSSGTRGSGIFNNNGYTEINYSTIANNTSTNASAEGVESFGDDQTGTRITASIVAGNTSSGQPKDVGNSNGNRAFESGGYNVIGQTDRASDFTAQGDTTGRTVEEAFGTANPALADNGGSTRTIALQSGSVAIDRAASGPDTDQRGFIRPFDDPGVTNGAGSNGTDSGSFELGAMMAQTGPGFVVTREDDRDQSCAVDDCSLREAVKAANTNATADEITFDLEADDRTITLTQGQLTASATQETTIDGGEDEITIDANDASRIFTVSSGGSLALRSITLTDGNSSSSGGGAILNNGTLTLTDSTISGNSASSIGGGINNNGTVTITDSTISNNISSSFGGGINNFGTATVTGSTISGNSASIFGGGINSSSGILTVTGSTISNNTVSNRGGGIFSNTDSYSPNTTPPEDRTTITNSTISGNSSGSSGSGIFNNNGYTEINYSTIAGNTSTNAAVEGVESDGDPATGTRLTASIVAGNTSSGQPSDVGNSLNGDRPYESGGYNVIGAVDAVRDGEFTAPGDTTGRTVEEAFGTATPTLDDNDGPTQTIALEPGSIAINRIPASTQGVPEADQRGVERPQNSASDSGSFEFDAETDILVITPETLPDATEDEAYSQQLSASGSSEPYTFEVTEGELPDGLTLSGGGLISGTPTEEATTETFTVEAEDGSGFTGEREYTLTVIEVNDAPVVTTSPGQTTYTEGDDPTAVDPEIEVSDVDSQTLSSATVSITAGLVSSEDRLAYTNDGTSQGNIQGTYDQGSGVLTLTSQGSSATVEQWQSALRTVTYENTSLNPSTETRTITFIVNDGELESEPATKDVSVEAVNDSPVISDVPDQQIRENTSTGPIRFTVEDIDDPANELTVTGSSSNAGLVRQSGIRISGSGERRTVNVTPVRNQTGSTRITLTVEDPQGLTDTETFIVRVTQTPPPSNECTITGTQGDDVLRGTPGRDVICGLGGDDTLIGGAGDDIIRGGPGDDALKGGPGDDVLIGGPGRDALDGGSGKNELRQ